MNVRRDREGHDATARVPATTAPSPGGGGDDAAHVRCPYCQRDVVGSTLHMFGLCVKGGKRA